MVADYSMQIEKAAFDALYRKLEPNIAWSEGSHVAWTVIANEALAEAESSAHTVARSWLNAEIQSWAAKVEKPASSVVSRTIIITSSCV